MEHTLLLTLLKKQYIYSTSILVGLSLVQIIEKEKQLGPFRKAKHVSGSGCGTEIFKLKCCDNYKKDLPFKKKKQKHMPLTKTSLIRTICSSGSLAKGKGWHQSAFFKNQKAYNFQTFIILIQKNMLVTSPH